MREAGQEKQQGKIEAEPVETVQNLGLSCVH